MGAQRHGGIGNPDRRGRVADGGEKLAGDFESTKCDGDGVAGVADAESFDYSGNGLLWFSEFGKRNTFDTEIGAVEIIDRAAYCLNAFIGLFDCDIVFIEYEIATGEQGVGTTDSERARVFFQDEIEGSFGHFDDIIKFELVEMVEGEVAESGVSFRGKTVFFCKIVGLDR